MFGFQSTEFDLVITDQTLPSITRSELSRKLMQIKEDIPETSRSRPPIT